MNIKKTNNSAPGVSFFSDIKEDLLGILAYEEKQANLRNILWAILGPDAYVILFLFRLRKLALKYKIPFVNRLLRGLTTALYAIELGANIELGHGVYFVHSVGTVVGGNAIIGKGTVLMGCNTIGTVRDNGNPVIGEMVTIGAGARVLGPIKIGDQAKIGANAVVIKDVPAGASCVGVPGKVVE